METNAENKIEVIEPRSYARCIKLGLTMTRDHLWVVLHHTWPSVILCVIFPLLGFFLFAGGLDRLCQEWKALGYVPTRKVKDGWKEDLRLALLAFCRQLVVALASVIVSLAWLASYRFLPHGMWVSLLVTLVLVLALLPIVSVLEEMSCYCSTWKSCLSTFGLGYKHYGSLFSFQFLLLILTLLLIFPGAAPFSITTLVSMKAYFAHLMGESVSMPPEWIIEVTVAYVAFILSTLGVLTMRSFCHMLFWGALQARDKKE